MHQTITASWGRLDDVLRPAGEHAAVGDHLPALRAVPAPLRWAGRAVSRAVYALAGGLTRRQKAYNLSVLQAVNMLAARVRELEGAAALAAVAAPGDDRPRSFPVLFELDGVSWMSYPERVLLYSLVYGVRPRRALEIGTFQGGSARVMVAAMDDAGAGRLFCVDPNPRLAPTTAAAIAHRATVVAGPSPDALREAAAKAGGLFDFALIDGDHSYDGVVRDIEGTLPVVAQGSLLLFHDAHYQPVARGIDDMKTKHPALTEVGMLSTPSNPDRENPGVLWGGIRVLRYDPK